MYRLFCQGNIPLTLIPLTEKLTAETNLGPKLPACCNNPSVNFDGDFICCAP